MYCRRRLPNPTPRLRDDDRSGKDGEPLQLPPSPFLRSGSSYIVGGQILQSKLRTLPGQTLPPPKLGRATGRISPEAQEFKAGFFSLWCFAIWRLLAPLSVALATGIAPTAVAQTTRIKRRIVYGLKRLFPFFKMGCPLILRRGPLHPLSCRLLASPTAAATTTALSHRWPASRAGLHIWRTKTYRGFPALRSSNLPQLEAPVE